MIKEWDRENSLSRLSTSGTEIELTSKQFDLEMFTMVNNMRKESLLTIVAEWLEEGGIPPLVLRDQHAIEPEKLNRILAVVGPRRAGRDQSMINAEIMVLGLKGKPAVSIYLTPLSRLYDA